MSRTTVFFEKKIISEINKFNSLSQFSSPDIKLGICNNIIELINLASPQENLLKKSLYKWVRYFIKYSIESNEEMDTNYHLFNKEQIMLRIEYCELREQISLIKFTLRELIKSGFDEEVDDLRKSLSRKMLREIKSKLSIRNFPKFLYYYSTSSKKNAIFIMASIFIGYSVLLLPLPNYFEPFAAFKIRYEGYSENFLINHISNCLLSFFQVESGFEIIPIGWNGVLFVILIKTVIFLFFYEFIVEIIKKIS
ncbi:hypothetical protein [Arcticibacterium luteifluviistationis]|uniref:Uncharacterized protein n=1 Tax=Arcticibacterium luteifluviistationis TaxID=1784714 RepID=A0A2Z4G716_9BACT|nr:hypothetical protein [Arcticibacterium luteifluviistationis]AWV96962.1 hypothetical protein DJ013_01730 [Arcticibacterium luteifluviistationis]